MGKIDYADCLKEDFQLQIYILMKGCIIVPVVETKENYTFNDAFTKRKV